MVPSKKDNVWWSDYLTIITLRAQKISKGGYLKEIQYQTQAFHTLNTRCLYKSPTHLQLPGWLKFLGQN